MTSHGNIAINGGFATIMSGIFVEALESLVNWFLAMTFIIIADLESLDTDLGKMIAWDGTSWVNLDGTALV